LDDLLQDEDEDEIEVLLAIRLPRNFHEWLRRRVLLFCTLFQCLNKHREFSRLIYLATDAGRRDSRRRRRNAVHIITSSALSSRITASPFVNANFPQVA